MLETRNTVQPVADLLTGERLLVSMGVRRLGIHGVPLMLRITHLFSRFNVSDYSRRPRGGEQRRYVLPVDLTCPC